MQIKAVLFDFDDTLAPEAESFNEALRNVGKLAVARHGLDIERLIATARLVASDEWEGSELFASGAIRGISASEVFSAAFWEQDIGAGLQAESDRMRPVVWRRTLNALGIEDEPLVDEMSEASTAEGTGPHTPYPGAEELIAQFAERFPLGIVTNGDSNVQRRKVKRSGLESQFKTIVVSGDFGLTVAKPDPQPFLHALKALDSAPSATVMIGNDQVNDVHGAAMLGMRTVWVNRTGQPFNGPTPPDHEIADLRELQETLGI